MLKHTLHISSKTVMEDMKFQHTPPDTWLLHLELYLIHLSYFSTSS